MTNANALLTVMFPGQGSQSVGMAKEILDLFPKTRQIFEEASDAISFNLTKLCIEGAAAEIEPTANQQPAILTLSYAYWTVLKNEIGLSPALFMGHSLGEYSALVASSKLNFSDAVYLVRRRGEAMQKAVPAGEGSMAAVIGMTEESLKDLCQAEPGCVEVVNFNSPNQQIISGTKASVMSLGEKLKKLPGIRCLPLAVSAPFHSSLMAKAREEMEPLLKAKALATNSNKIIANLTGKLEDPYHIDLLIKQIDSPVLWTKSLAAAEFLGATKFIEVGPGRVLAGLAKKTLSGEAKIFSTFGLAAALKELPALKI